MKSYLPLLLTCACAWPVHAAAQTRFMNVTTTSAEVKKIEVTTQTRITFSKDLNEMIVSTGNPDQTQKFTVDEITNIVFTIDSTTDIAEQPFDDLAISHSDGIVTISGTGTIDFAVWNTSGALVTSGRGSDTVNVDLSAASAGIYIIKANNKTLKFIKH